MVIRACLACLFLVHAAVAKPKSVTMWLVFDGLSEKHLKLSPHLQAFAEKGVKVQDVRPSFPSSKYPNYASMFTGYYPETHDVLDEEVYNATSKSKETKDQPEFWESVRKLGTIWVIEYKSTC